MKADAIFLNAKDNVVTVVNGAKAGQKVNYYNGDTLCSIDTIEDIPPCHKIALTQMAQGDRIIKYGEVIGAATKDIAKGAWVSHLNIDSLPRDYAEELK